MPLRFSKKNKKKVLAHAIATCTNDVAIYTVYYHAFWHAFCPRPDSYFYSALSAHQALSSWAHNVYLTWIPGHSQLLGLRSLKKSLDYAPSTLLQPFTLPILRSVIKHTKNVDWAEATLAWLLNGSTSRLINVRYKWKLPRPAFTFECSITTSFRLPTLPGQSQAMPWLQHITTDGILRLATFVLWLSIFHLFT
jgi:hypothetical protein